MSREQFQCSHTHKRRATHPSPPKHTKQVCVSVWLWNEMGNSDFPHSYVSTGTAGRQRRVEVGCLLWVCVWTCARFCMIHSMAPFAPFFQVHTVGLVFCCYSLGCFLVVCPCVESNGSCCWLSCRSVFARLKYNAVGNYVSSEISIRWGQCKQCDREDFPVCGRKRQLKKGQCLKHPVWLHNQTKLGVDEYLLRRHVKTHHTDPIVCGLLSEPACLPICHL